MKIKSVMGIITTVLGLLLLIGVSFGTHADVGSGTFHFYFLTLLFPLVLSVYAIWKSSIQWMRISFGLGFMICTSILMALYTIEKEQYTLVFDLFHNVESIYLGMTIFMMGLGISLYRWQKR